MSKSMKNLKKRLRAPHNLKEAVKQGERLAPAYKADTRATHLRRFSTVIAAYACVAALLIGGVAILPAFWNSQAPVAGQSSGEITPAVTVHPGYVYPTGEDAENFVHPELIWASHLNPGLKDVVIWAAEVGETESGEKEPAVVKPAGFPFVDLENPRYAVEVKMELLGTAGSDEKFNMSSMKRYYASVEGAMKMVGIEPIKNEENGYDLGIYGNVYPAEGNIYLSKYYEIGKDQLTKEDEAAMLEILANLPANTRIEIKMAWQPKSVLKDYEEIAIWKADQLDGKQTIRNDVITDTVEKSEEYVVRIMIEDASDFMTMTQTSLYQRKIAQMEEALKAAGFVQTDMELEIVKDGNEYYLAYFKVSGNDLSAFDSSLILSYMDGVNTNLVFTMDIIQMNR